MPDIDELRGSMDGITLDMVRLLKRRTDVAREIGEAKRSAGMGVTDEARETSLRAKVAALAEDAGLDGALAARFLNFLIGESVRVQAGGWVAPGAAEGGQTHLSVFARAKEIERAGRRVIHMEVGEPDFMPPPAVGAALRESFDMGLVRYGPAAGRPEFREALARRESADHGARVEPGNILVTPGARFSVFLAITTLLRPGDELVVIEPAWPAYRDCALRAGVRVRPVRTTLEGGWEPSLEEISEAVGPNTGMIALNYPNNPTGKVLPAAVQDGIMEIAGRGGIYVLSDEIYSQYARSAPRSVLEYGYDRSVVARSFSKSHAMTGFRIGYAVAQEPVIREMSKLQALSLTSVPEPVQHAAMAALAHDASGNASVIRSRLDLLAGEARGIGLEFAEPDGAMYLFARAGRGGGFDGIQLARRALEEGGVAVAPGAGFGGYGEFIRISACAGERALAEGMGILGEILKESGAKGGGGRN